MSIRLVVARPSSDGSARPPIPDELTRALVGWVARHSPLRLVRAQLAEEEFHGTHTPLPFPSIPSFRILFSLSLVLFLPSYFSLFVLLFLSLPPVSSLSLI